MSVLRLLPNVDSVESALTGALMPAQYRSVWHKADFDIVKQLLEALEEVNVLLIPMKTSEIAPELAMLMYEMWKRGYKIRWIHPSLEILFQNTRPTLYVYDAVHAVEDQGELANFIELYGRNHKHILISPHRLSQRLMLLVEASCGRANS